MLLTPVSGSREPAAPSLLTPSPTSSTSSLRPSGARTSASAAPSTAAKRCLSRPAAEVHLRPQARVACPALLLDVPADGLRLAAGG